MQPCKKVKNPCKICFDHVSKKHGLQCQGACQKWAHFKCLNYTPGKIHDIKTGVIKVTCPCPDCNSTEPKEILVNPPFACNNTKCPVNQPSNCQSQECATNNHKPAPVCPIPQAFNPVCQDRSSSPVGRVSKTVSPINPNDFTQPYNNAPKTCPPTRCQPTKGCANTSSPKGSTSYSDVSDSDGKLCNAHQTASDSKLTVGDDQQSVLVAIQTLADTVGQLSDQLKELITKMAGEPNQPDC